MKILLCLLSEQSMPNLLSVHAYKPDHLVLLETKQMKTKGVVDNLIKALAYGGLDYGKRHDAIEVKDGFSMQETLAATRMAYGKFPAGEWLVNVTGGTKPMSLATYEFFKVLGGYVFYVNPQEPRVMRALGGVGEDVTSDHQVTCREFARTYGKELVPGHFDSDKADLFFELARAVARDPEALGVAGLDPKLRGRIRDGKAHGADLPEPVAKTSGLVKAFDSHFKRLAKAGYPFDKAGPLGIGGDGRLTGKVDKGHGDFLTGGWLELFVYGMLKRPAARELGISDPRIGMRLDTSKGNELDVMFMQNLALCVVECKSGMEHDKGFDALYKLETVVNQFKALRRKTWFATTGREIYEKDSKPPKIREHIESRCRELGCTIISPEAVVALANASPEEEPGMLGTLFPERA